VQTQRTSGTFWRDKSLKKVEDFISDHPGTYFTLDKITPQELRTFFVVQQAIGVRATLIPEDKATPTELQQGGL
jgi:hypothetical protein